MSVNSPDITGPVNENPLETGIRPLEEVATPARFAYGRTVAAPATIPPLASMGALSNAAIVSIAAANGYSMDDVQQIGAKLQGNEAFAALCQEQTGMSLSDLTAQLMGSADDGLHASASEMNAAVADATFDAGKNGKTVTFMGLGPTEIVIIGIIAILLFGKRLPEVLKGLGRGIRGFKQEVSGIQEGIDKAGQGDGSGEPEDGDEPVDDGTEVEPQDEEDGR